MNILITGGSSGLGKSIVKLCCQNPENKIYFTYSRKKEAADEISKTYPNAMAIKVDYTDKVSLSAFVSKIPAFDLDVLVNNAWVGSPNGTYFHKTALDDFSTAFETNVLPLIEITQACLVCFRKKKNGKIITILTSYLLNLPPMGYSVYTATKAYIEQLTKCWAKEYVKFGITSNCISPEYMQTSFAEVDERIIEQMIVTHPLKKLLQPEEVAEVVMFIINASKQLNGVNIPVNAAQNIIK